MKEMLRRITNRLAIIIFLGFCQYHIGVLNEKNFPGERWLPLPGEWIFWLVRWAALAVSIFLAWQIYRIAKRGETRRDS